MAASGSFNTSAFSASDGTRYLVFAWTETSQNITANTTTISWTLKGGGTSTQAINGRAIKLTINGETVYSFPGSATSYKDLKNGTLLASGTYTFTHKTDGSQTFTAYAEAGIYTWDVNCTGSQTFTLDTIPRATTPTVGASVRDMGDYVTIYTNRASDAFTHDLAYSFMGGAYQTIATGVGTWHNWTIPDLASQIPNTTSGTATIRCITKSGSTIVGTKTVTMTLKVPASVVPTISAVTVTETTDGLAAQFRAFIQGKSALNVKVTAAGAKGSTISNYKTTLQGVPYTDASFTTNVLAQAGTLNLVATVTDSRGRTATKTLGIVVLPYTPPHVSEFKAFRCDENGYAKDDGTYLSVSYAYDVAACGGKNTADMVIEYKRSTATDWTALATGSDLEGSGIRFFYNGPTFSTDYQYDVRMTVTDWFGHYDDYEGTLPSADVVLDISSDGKGLGIGKVSQRSGATEFARIMYDRFDTVIGNGLAQYSGSGDGGIDPDATLEHLVLTNKNTPTTAFWYVMTLFYATKSDTANRTQFALPYNQDGSFWVRRYFNGAWTDWVEDPVVVESGTNGLWTYIKWSDGRVELSGTHWLFGMGCTTALGGWYRTDVIQPEAFPFPVYDQNLLATYESDGYGAVLWATTTTTTTKPANYYLIRPTSATIENGKIAMRVTGRWK